MQRWQALPQAVLRGDALALAGLGVPRAIDSLHKLCHDAMAVAAGASARFFPSLPPGADLEALVAWGKTLARVARFDEHPWNAPLLVDALVAEGRACWSHGRDAGVAKALTRMGAR